jgi:glucose-1-phosphate adenylyltransferase
VNTDVLALILGGGRGTRLFPVDAASLQARRPIGGKYRLIDIPISNCLHADMRRIFVLTQFNSASLNRHIAQPYRMDLFSHGFVEILAAEQTPDNPNWFQGRPMPSGRRRALLAARRGLLPDSRGRSPVPDGLSRDARIARRPPGRHHDCRAAGAGDEAPAMGIFRFDRSGQIVAFEEKARARAAAEIERSIPPVDVRADHAEAPFMASTGIYVFSRDVLLDTIDGDGATDFGREVIPDALARYRVQASPVSRLLGGRGNRPRRSTTRTSCWRARGAVQVLRPAAADLYASAVPAGCASERLHDPREHHQRGCYIERAAIENRLSASARAFRAARRFRGRLLLGADFYEADDEATVRGDNPAPRHRPRRRAGPRDCRQECADRRRRAACQRARRRARRRPRAISSATGSSSSPRTA